MVGKGNGKIKNSQATAYQYRTERPVLLAQVMGKAGKQGPAAKPNGYPSGFVNPFIINGIFYKKSDAEDKDGNANFVRQVFTNEFFEIGIVAYPLVVKRFLYCWGRY